MTGRETRAGMWVFSASAHMLAAVELHFFLTGEKYVEVE